MSLAQGALLVPLSTWLLSVNRTVSQPYLDEVFHVRQAQHYCAGNFHIWDPKITTPPGLYLLSYALSQLALLGGNFGIKIDLPLLGCNLFTLRAINALGLLLLVPLLSASYRARNGSQYKLHRLPFAHSTLNIALFPPLFFFSALYYTDIWSTVSVVVFHVQVANARKNETGAWSRYIRLVCLGLVCLTFRQTNIFWITVFPAGMALIRHIDERGHQAVRDSMRRGVEGFGDTAYSTAKTSWKMEVVYDPVVRDASINSYFKSIVSIGASILKLTTQPARLTSLLAILAPYLTLLAMFAGFIFWNGSVVLGDKANHVATLHLPQTLYLWPTLVFFSWPLLYPYLLLLPITAIVQLPVFTTLESIQIFKRRALLPRPWLAATFLVIACATVWGNTIVHPFTLADNRHYVFYIFRLLLRPWWVRYAVTPVYFLCGWACIQALGGGPPAAWRIAGTLPDGEHSATTSFVLVWLVTSALQLITAPLVEPRYIILPWLMWRMHMPLRMPPTGAGSSGDGSGTTTWTWKSLWEEYDHRLWLETAWLVAVNLGTGYIFLQWGFEWPQEVGQVQRFMW